MEIPLPWKKQESYAQKKYISQKITCFYHITINELKEFLNTAKAIGILKLLSKKVNNFFFL